MKQSKADKLDRVTEYGTAIFTAMASTVQMIKAAIQADGVAVILFAILTALSGILLCTLHATKH